MTTIQMYNTQNILEKANENKATTDVSSLCSQI